MAHRYLGFRTLVLVALSTGARRAAAEIADVWVVDDGTKVLRDDVRHRLKAGNLTFDRGERRVSLSGARNETLAFQVVIEGGAAPTEQVSVRLPEIGEIRNGELASGADRYFINRRIELLLEKYVPVSSRSESLAWQPWTDAVPEGLPKGWLGFVPDPLVPLRAGASFRVEARQNQAVWVDIYVPKTASAGTHAGKLTVEVAGAPCALPTCTLDVTLQVLDAVLPDEPSTKTMLWFSGSDDERDTFKRYFQDPWHAPDAEVEALRTRHFHLARRHRVTLFLGRDRQPTRAVEQRLNGTLFTREQGYEGPGEGLGQDMYSILTYGVRDLESDEARRWAEWFRDFGRPVEYFYYAKDEPTRGDFAEVNRRARAAEPVPAFSTVRYTAELDIDIHASLPNNYSLRDKALAEKAGRRYWIYNGTRPYSGTFVIDDSAVSTRVNPWIQYKYGIGRWFYWESTYYRDFQGSRGQIDVWQTALNFTNHHGDRMNGDGLLFYPGRDLIFPESDHGYDMPLPSIRLKNWRRGIEDVEYLVLAKKAGHQALVSSLLERMIPAALADGMPHADDPARFPDDGEHWLEARRLLATALASGRAPEVPKHLGLAAPGAPERAIRVLKRLKRENWKGRRKLALIGGFVLGSAALLGLGLKWVRARRRA